MRVLLVNKYWHMVGGVEKYCFLVQDWLEERGHEVVPFAMESPANVPTKYARYFPNEVSFTDDRFSAVAAAKRAVMGRDARQSIELLLNDYPCDVAFVVHPYHQLGTAILPEIDRREIPTILSIHDYKLCCPRYRLFSDRTGEICTKCLRSPKLSAVAPAVEQCWQGSGLHGGVLGLEAITAKMRRAYSRADVVLVLNDLQAECAEVGGVSKRKIRRIPHFVEPDPNHHWRPHGPDAPVLYVGRLSSEKGVNVLIHAVQQAGARLRIAGQGPAEAHLRELAEGSGSVEFLGMLDPEDVKREMRAASMMVVPSIWHEVSPFVIYEAFAVGVPVIGSSVGGVPDLLRDGRGRLVPPDDIASLAAAIKDWRDDPTASQRASSRARAHAQLELSRAQFDDRLTSAFASAGVAV